MRAIRSTDLQTRTKEVLDLAASGETFIVSRPQNRNAVIISEDRYNSLLSALEAEEHRAFVNRELDKSLAREDDPQTKWFSGEEVKKMLGL
jgi:PHD/YefM family antitoxin component YafN of YafNO toxin-antitoxin module